MIADETRSKLKMVIDGVPVHRAKLRPWRGQVEPRPELWGLAGESTGGLTEEEWRKVFVALDRHPAHDTPYLISGLLNAADISQERRNEILTDLGSPAGWWSSGCYLCAWITKLSDIVR